MIQNNSVLPSAVALTTSTAGSPHATPASPSNLPDSITDLTGQFTLELGKKPPLPAIATFKVPPRKPPGKPVDELTDQQILEKFRTIDKNIDNWKMDERRSLDGRMLVLTPTKTNRETFSMALYIGTDNFLHTLYTTINLGTLNQRQYTAEFGNTAQIENTPRPEVRAQRRGDVLTTSTAGSPHATPASPSNLPDSITDLTDQFAKLEINDSITKLTHQFAKLRIGKK